MGLRRLGRRRLKRLRQVGENAQAGCLKQCQVRSQPSKILLLLLVSVVLLSLALRIAVRFRAVKGAPLGLPTPPTYALPARLLPFRRSGWLRRLRTVSREMSKLLAAVALIAAGRGHRGSPVRDRGPRRLARLLVHKKAVGDVLKTVDRYKLVSVVHLPDEVEFRGRRQARELDIQVDSV